MEVKEFFRERTRMFDSLRDAEYRGDVECFWVSCSNCPLYATKTDDCLNNTEQSVDIVERWSKEHPIKTIMDDFFEKYPKADKYEDGKPAFCAKGLGYKVECEVDGCRNCWNTPLGGWSRWIKKK